jgi:hypothetical protein
LSSLLPSRTLDIHDGCPALDLSVLDSATDEAWEVLDQIPGDTWLGGHTGSSLCGTQSAAETGQSTTTPSRSASSSQQPILYVATLSHSTLRALLSEHPNEGVRWTVHTYALVPLVGGLSG